MGGIQRRSGVCRTALSEEFYFQSLLEEAHRLGELSEVELESIMGQYVGLLSVMTERFNRGMSSSVKIETAQQIAASNFYTIGLYCKSLPDTASALAAIRNESIAEAYRKGRESLDSELRRARELYRVVRVTRIRNPDLSYNATIDEGLELFFSQYDPDFGSHQMPASIDYQLLNPVTGLAGVEYMNRYLGNLYAENIFCSRFDDTAIDEAMRGYHPEYEDLLVNICGQVLQNALGCAMCGRDPRSLNVARADLTSIASQLQGKTVESIRDVLAGKAEVVLTTLDLGEPHIREYILGSLTDIASSVRVSLDTGTLETVFTARRSRGRSRIIKYSSGLKMDDEKYRSIVNRILACRLSEDRVEIIKQHVKTLSDMEDIICDGELTEEEALSVFRMLEDIDIAAMVKRHPYSPDTEDLDLPQSELQLRRYLDKYLRTMPADRLQRLRSIMSDMEEPV